MAKDPPLHATAVPSPWVQRFAAHIPAHATALDLASGSGHNGRWLMGRGLHVTFLDRDVSAIADLAWAEDAEIIKADLETGERFPILGRQFDCVVVTNYLWRDILDDICKAVTPGGWLIYETFGTGNEAFGRPRNPDFLLRPGELAETVRDSFRIIGYEHGQRDIPSPAVIQRLAAIRQ